MPVKSVGQPTFGFPDTVIVNQTGKQAGDEFPVPVYEIAIPDGGSEPTAVFVEMRSRFSVNATQPEAGVVVKITRIAQPAAFGQMVAHSATDGVVCAGVADGRKKLREDKAPRSLDQMLPERPPTEVVDLLDLRIRALKARDVPLQPSCSLGVGDVVGDPLLFHCVEDRDVACQRVCSQGLEVRGSRSQLSEKRRGNRAQRRDPLWRRP